MAVEYRCLAMTTHGKRCMHSAVITGYCIRHFNGISESGDNEKNYVRN